MSTQFERELYESIVRSDEEQADIEKRYLNAVEDGRA
jgi:hypothetical protein